MAEEVIPTWTVEWTMEIDGATPEEAALKAWEAVRRKGSIANTFTCRAEVRPGKFTTEIIDLQDMWECEELTAEQAARMEAQLAQGLD